MPEENYVCSLSPAMIEVASRELRETEARKSQSIEQLRELIKLNPQIKMCRTGN